MTNDAPAQASVEAVLKKHLRISIDQDWDGMKYAILGIDEAAAELAALSPPPTVGAEDEAPVAWQWRHNGQWLNCPDGWSERAHSAGREYRALYTRPSPSAVEGWREMNTAPMDGTEALVTGFIFNDPSKGRWQQVAAWNGYEWATEQAPIHPPTHWKPLGPEPVSCIASAKGGL